MSNENDKNKQIALIGGIFVAGCIIMGCRRKENDQLMLEERNKDMELRRIKSLRRQEFLHNIIYKLFKIEF